MNRLTKCGVVSAALWLANALGVTALADCAPPPSDLVSWWMAEGNARDSIGSNNGTATNGATFAAGEVGQAFKLDGVDDYVDASILPELQNATAITVVAWINRSDNSNAFSGIVGKWDTAGSTSNSFLLYTGEGTYADKGGAVFGFDDNSTTGVGGVTTIPTNQWVFIAATWRSSDGFTAIYKNGVLDASSSGGVGRILKYHAAFSAKIGEWGVVRSSAYKFKGQIDEPMIFNRALSQSEIQAIYNAGPSGLCQSGLTTVSNTNDKGLGSLRAAVNYTNAHAGPDTITFTAAVTDLIFLQNDQLTIVDDLTIAGPGARVLSVTGNFDRRVFEIAAGKTVTISDLGIRDGVVSLATGIAAGGGVLNNGNLTLTRCRVFNNRVYSANTHAVGGGIHNGPSGALLVQKSEISGNSASSGGGSSTGIILGGGLYNNGAATLTDSTFGGNYLAAAGPTHQTRLGAGISTEPIQGSPGSVALRNCTIAGNAIDTSVFGFCEGGGISKAGPVTIENTIVAGNMSAIGPDVRGSSFTSGGHNLIGLTDSSTGWNTNAADPHHDLTGNTTNGAQPAGLVNGYDDNGGPTNTFALLAGSAAIDAGNDAKASPTDQRGFVRVGVSDIGAFEFGGTAPTPTPTPTPTPIPTPTPSTTLANISTRLRVETGDNALIGGFIVTGTQPKKVIVRALGPSVPVPGALANPTLELYSGSTLLESNDNWIDSPNKQAIIDSTIPPSNELESAIVRTLPANGTGYTAIVRGVNNATGIGVVEAYDLDRSTDSKLANISTRGLVQTGDNVLIAGTIVVGSTTQKVIVRAIGPSLPIPGRLENPTLELRDSNGGLLEANDNWIDSPNKQAIIDSTIPPTNDSESAIVRMLSPANYTAILRGVNDTTGIAVVEVYALN